VKAVLTAPNRGSRLLPEKRSINRFRNTVLEQNICQWKLFNICAGLLTVKNIACALKHIGFAAAKTVADSYHFLHSRKCGVLTTTRLKETRSQKHNIIGYIIINI
jgi:hypothetical protein